MFSKSAITTLIILATTTACAVPAGDDADEASVSSVSSDLRRGPDDVPMPNLPVPTFEDLYLPRRWDLKPFVDELQHSYELGQCVLRYKKIFDPAHGKEIELPVVVCP